MVGGYGALPGGPTQNDGIRPVDGGLGAALGGVEDGDKLHDGVVTGLARNSKFSKRKRYGHHREGNHVETRVTNRGDLRLK